MKKIFGTILMLAVSAMAADTPKGLFGTSTLNGTTYMTLRTPGLGGGQNFQVWTKSTKPASMVRGFAITIQVTDAYGTKLELTGYIRNQESPYFLGWNVSLDSGTVINSVEVLDVVAAGGIKLTQEGSPVQAQ